MMRTVIFLMSLFFLGKQAMALSLTSSAFSAKASIPNQYTCDGTNISPPLKWEGAPSGTKTFVLICEDPDVPHTIRADGMYDHWVLFNIPPTTTSLPENMKSPPGGALQGVNTSKELGYTGPCPPDRQHRYFFKLFALDISLNLPEGATKADVLSACEDHILAQTELMGVYDRRS
jgi:Raf kinase inhibitor-like YbhB/YbcL family protein